MRLVVWVVALGGCDLVYSLDRPSTNGWVEVSVGNTHVCGRTRAGDLFCWGGNTVGQVGVGDELSTIDEPRAVTGSWAQVSTSYLHTCGIDREGILACWGFNTTGQLGVGSLTGTGIPKTLVGEWAKVDASYIGTCAIDTDDRLWCWGSNFAAQLGDETTVDRAEPVPIGTARWTDVAMAAAHTCGIQDDGTLWCWGSVTAPTTLGEPSISPMQLGTDSWSSLTATSTGSCGITTSRKLRCWGRNTRQQLGVGEVERADDPTPVLVAGRDEDDWVQVDGGANAACAVRANGDAWCWGDNERGALGGEDRRVAVPREVEHPEGARWVRVDVGAENACFVDAANRAWCAGANGFAQLGDGGTSPRRPTPPDPDVPANIVTAGHGVTCTLRDQQLACAGRGMQLQLGVGGELAERSLVPVPGMWDGITVGAEHACGLQGAVASCWGTDRFDSAGNGAGSTPSPLPTPVVGSRTFAAIDAGAYFTCGIDSTRAMYCWGENAAGQLGNTTTANSGTPVPVSTPTTFTWGAISAGGAHACGTQLTGIVRCWGSNERGQLGDGSTTDRRDASGQLAGALPAFTKVSAGTDHTCALGADNSIWCWGNNLRGQLGVDIFFTQLETPRRLEGVWIDVAAGDQFTCAVRMDSTLWCWGANSRGQLGDGSLVDRRLPVQVEGVGFTAVAVGTTPVPGAAPTSHAGETTTTARR